MSIPDNQNLHNAFIKFRSKEVDIITKQFWNTNKNLILKLALQYSYEKQYILDLGCGSGAYCTYLTKMNRNCTGVDPLWESSLKNITKNTELNKSSEYIQAYSEYIPLKSQQYDVILCISTLQHVNNQISTLHEIRRVAKPGAIAIFSVPQTFKKSTFNKLGLYTMHFNVKILKKILNENNFQIKKITGCGFFMPITGKLLMLIYPIIGNKTQKILKSLDFLSDKIPSLASSIIIITEVNK